MLWEGKLLRERRKYPSTSLMSQDKAAGQPTRETAMSLTAEQRRALAMLTHAGLNGASQASLMAHGFCISMIVGLVKRGLATVTREQVRAGGRLVDVGKVRITAAGRDALIAERWRSTLRARPLRVPEQDLRR
jgi:hypothetical protein